MATEVSMSAPSMAQLQSVQKAMAIPTVGAAVGQVGALYSRVKGAHSLLEWALSAAESGMTLAAAAAAPLVADHVAAGDARVAAAIDALGQRVPLVTQQPKVIVETTKQAVLTKISPHVNKVCGAKAAAAQRVQSLKELSWSKANALVSSAYAQKALLGVDGAAHIGMELLDRYLPPPPTEGDHTTEVSVSAVEAGDPLSHTVQSVGRLSSAAARRVWANLAYRVQQLRDSNAGRGIELDVRRYIAALLAALHLATVTGQQHRETEIELQQQQARQSETAAVVAPPAATSPPQSSAIPKASPPQPPKSPKVVKTTPEGKPKGKVNGDTQQPNNL